MNPAADRLKKEFSETNARVYPVINNTGKRAPLPDSSEISAPMIF